jgi:arylsulfatase A-like enzyme
MYLTPQQTRAGRTAAVLFLLLLPVVALNAQDRRPNVIVMLTDDQGWGDVGIHGNLDVRTPNLDRLASEGARFEHFYVQPVCSPTRAELLTGRHHPRGDVFNVTGGGERLRSTEKTIADWFRESGYRTAYFGKWHSGSQWPYHPVARGFEEFYGFLSGHWGHYFDWILEQNGDLVQGQGFIEDDLTDRAIRFIEDSRADPFFISLSYATPHSPMQVPDRFFDRFDGMELRMRRPESDRTDLRHTKTALAMVENIDWNVGRVLDALDQRGLLQHTIVVFLSDNGPNGWRWNADLRGIKGSTDEGGTRVPFFVYWPGSIGPGLHVTEIAGALDLLPTLADLAGIDLTRGPPLDGVSLAPLLSGVAAQWPDRYLFAHWNGDVSVRSPRYRLDREGRLYDIEADPGQQHDVTEDYPEIADALAQAVTAYRDDVLGQLTRETRPFPVGHAAFPTTHLHARDGTPHGEIQRSSRHPNDSFFTDWTTADGRITWGIDVATTGTYEAVVYYTAPPSSVGAIVELSMGDSGTRSVVAEAFDPPLVGADHDRSPRTESYVKTFRPLNMGRVRLAKGEGTLTLGAAHVPAASVIDVWRLTLRLLDE